MYIKHCKLSKNKQYKLLEHFVAGTPARTTTALISVHRNTAIKVFEKLRKKNSPKARGARQKICWEN